MNKKSPVYTEKTECRDCHRCLRICPVKAIKIESGSAFVSSDRCISCASCVSACPAGAKRIRDDLARVKDAISAGDAPIVSIAPSFVAEFSDWREEELFAALRLLGFSGVSETAIGAELVSAAVAGAFSNMSHGILISTACPVIVEMICKYYPELSPMLSPLCSPLLAHAKLLKKNFGNDKKIVFIGPCVAKKSEADMNPDLIMAALTFENIREWIKEENIIPANLRSVTNLTDFIYGRATKGRLYPVDGGMIASIKNDSNICDAEMVCVSGIEAVRKALEELDPANIEGKIFLELLACSGGCINGPAITKPSSTLLKRSSVISFSNKKPKLIKSINQNSVPIQMNRILPPFKIPEHSTAEIIKVLDSIGKKSSKDELNCDGCGHRDCRSFAVAVLEGRAEKEMCVSYMKQLAFKKANSLIKTIPSGVVIVDREMNIIEANRRFAEIVGNRTLEIYDSRGGFEGIPIENITPLLTPLLSYVLNSGNEINSKILKDSEKNFRVSAFIIEPEKTAGAIINCVSEDLVCGEELIKQANQLIKKNLITTQKIAYLLGENASEIQSSLSNIVQILSGMKEASSDDK